MTEFVYAPLKPKLILACVGIVAYGLPPLLAASALRGTIGLILLILAIAVIFTSAVRAFRVRLVVYSDVVKVVNRWHTTTLQRESLTRAKAAYAYLWTMLPALELADGVRQVRSQATIGITEIDDQRLNALELGDNKA